MKKIIKLTESDLTRIVKRVIKENNTKMELIDTIKDEGFKSASEMVGGSEILMKLLDIKTTMDFLHLFDDLDVVQNEKKQDLTLFRYKPYDNLMIYDRENDLVYVSYKDIWSVLGGNFGLNYSEIQELIKEWLDEVYNLRGITPSYATSKALDALDEVYNLRNRI
jgi:hypothetical protein